MKHVYYLFALAGLATGCYGMDDFCKAAAGERVRYMPTSKEEQELPIRVLNQTGKPQELKAVYTCSTESSYTLISCFTRCCTRKSLKCTQECEDDSVICKNGQTITLTPVNADIFRSRLKLMRLLVLKKGEIWQNVPLPSAQNPDLTVMTYQGMPKDTDGAVCTLLQNEDESLALI